MNNRQEELELELERQRLIQKERQQRIEEEWLIKLHKRQEEHNRWLWNERLEAELLTTQKKLEMEKSARSTTAKLPKLKITPFDGMSTDWVRFENMFLTQVHGKPISAEEKFVYLLEMVSHKVREKIANLKPGEVGYKVAWERLKVEYGQTKQVVSAHLDEIVNLPVIKGSNYTRIQEFYEALSSNHNAQRICTVNDQ